MFNKRIILLTIFLLSLLAVSAVSATDNITGDNVGINDDEVINIDLTTNEFSNDLNLVKSTSNNNSFEENTVVEENLNENDVLSNVEEDVLSNSPPYNKYKVSVSDITTDYGSYKSIPISINSVSYGYTNKYDFYFKIYDSDNVQKVSQRYYSTSSSNSETYQLWGSTLSDPGIYTMKIINFADNQVMSTATLTLNSVPYNKYRVSVSDTTINYGSGGSIKITITPSTSSTSSTYRYKYDFYLKIYDSKNVEKISQRYYSSSSPYSLTYSIPSYFNSGNYTVKIMNNVDNHVMATAKLIVKAKLNYNSYSVDVEDTSFTYGFGGHVSMSISPASSDYIYSHDFYLKVYDSSNNVKISKRYYGANKIYSESYFVGPTTLNPGVYTIKIINNADNNVMDTAKLTVNPLIFETKDLNGYCDEIIEFKVRVGEQDKFKSGLIVIFNCNDEEYSDTTDDEGYASFNVHLKSGIYKVITKFNNVVKINSINIQKKYVSNVYKNVVIKSESTVFNSNKKIIYGWEGNLNGYLKIYKGKSLVYNEKLNTNGYIDDYFKYKKYSYNFPIKKLKSCGKFTAKIMDSSGKVISISSFKISKSPTNIECDSFKTKLCSKKNIRAYVYDNGGNDVNGGTAKFKINGKNYKAKVKHGVAKVKVKFPNKVKTYKCKVKYLGDKNHKVSSAKFKIKASKLGSIVNCFPPSVKTGSKHTLYVYAAIKDFDGEYSLAKHGVVKLKIAGKTYKAKVKKGIAKVKIKAPSNAKTYKCKVSYSCGKTIKTSSDMFNLVVKKPVSKYKVITTYAKNYWITKKSGNFKVKTKIWDMTAGIRAPYKLIDTTLYKNGKQVYPTKYSVKYKINGKWTGWTKYGTISTAHHRNSVLDSASISQIKVKVKKNVNSYI